jgi:small GTP-binding protein
MKPFDAKVVFLGATHVGKTSIIARAVTDTYDPSQQESVAASFSVKLVNLETRSVRLLLWDTAGAEQYRTLGSLYYHGAQGIIIVFALDDKDTLTDAEQWAAEVRNHFEFAPHVFLVGNKVDLVERRCIPREEAAHVADKIGAR